MKKRARTTDGIGWDADKHSARRLMEFVVAGLNGPVIRVRRAGIQNARFTRRRVRQSEMEVELRRLVEEWRCSGPNVTKLLSQEPELDAFRQRGRITSFPTDGARVYLEWSASDVIEGISSPLDVARDRLMTLITNPNCQSLQGPCPSCGDYFLKVVDRLRVYCSPRCGAKVSAVKAVNSRRKREHLEKVRKAQGHIEKWKEKPRRADWKTWIVQDVDFTRRWVTRAVNNGDLVPPVV